MPNKILWMSALLACLFTTGAQAQASDALNPPTENTVKKKAKKPKPQAAAKAKFVAGSEESKKERDTRLTRECKGEVNAGACTGYTR
jgi:Tfp pilus assembly protein PilN